jgi:hypothetical protein
MAGMSRAWILPTALILFGLTSVSHAEDKAASQARLQRADALTRLDDPALKPWYLKTNFSLFDDNGKLAEQGTLEEWWAGPSMYKRTITSPSYTATIIVNKDGRFRTAGSAEAPYLLEQLERQIVHPLPGEGEIAGATPQLQKPAASGPPVDCVMLSRTLRNVPYPQIGLFPTYCMDHDKDVLKVSYDYGSFMAVRSALGMFQQRVMPVELMIYMNRVTAASSRIVALKTAPLTEADFVPPAGMEPDATERVTLPYRDIRDTHIANIAPVTPPGLQPSVLSQAVEIHVRLGTDGHVHAMRLASTPDPLLATAAMAAVVRWTYAPHLVNGKAVEVETTIPVMFSNSVGLGEIGPKR